ncbi:MAG: hypothetical protein CMF50_07100 [Legionellales bacterium]|nr:hypothetical protein [Legionellales bacterium]|tara:strand:- start:2104 stop:3264 length:1161 start_codon:yes stop_codon:yes gene_type:complete
MLLFGQKKIVREGQRNVLAVMEQQAQSTPKDKIAIAKAGLRAVVANYLNVFNSTNANAKVVRYIQQFLQQDKIDEQQLAEVFEAAAQMLIANESDKLLRLLDMTRAYFYGKPAAELSKWLDRADSDSDKVRKDVACDPRGQGFEFYIPMTYEEASPLVDRQLLQTARTVHGVRDDYVSRLASDIAKLPEPHVVYMYKLDVYYSFTRWRASTQGKSPVSLEALQNTVRHLCRALANLASFLVNPLADNEWAIILDLREALAATTSAEMLITTIKLCRQRAIAIDSKDFREVFDIAVAIIDGLQTSQTIIRHIEDTETRDHLEDYNAQMRLGKMAYSSLEKPIVRPHIFAQLPEVAIQPVEPLVRDDYTLPVDRDREMQQIASMHKHY